MEQAVMDSVFATVVSTFYMFMCVKLYSFLASFLK